MFSVSSFHGSVLCDTNASLLTELQNLTGIFWREMPPCLLDFPRNFVAIHSGVWPLDHEAGLSFWLLIMKSRVRFQVLPRGFFLEGEGPLGDHGLGSFVEFRFKAPPGTSYSYTTIHLIVTAAHGRPNLRSRLHFGHNREGRPRSP
jgi:hypothetical protein